MVFYYIAMYLFDGIVIMFKFNCMKSERNAFTFAELLIILGIIGIVAAMTISSLVKNYTVKQWDTSAIVFEKKLLDALNIMNAQSTLAVHESTEAFVTELSKHIKISSVCNKEELAKCFSSTIYFGNDNSDVEKFDIKILRTAKNFGQKTWGTNIVGVLFANGTSALIAYNPIKTGNTPCVQDPTSNQVDGNDCIAILYDTTSFHKPNTIRKDLRSNRNVLRLGTGCVFEVGDTCFSTAPFIPKPISKEECEKIKDDLGIKYCKYATDYWAGAIKECGGVSKMPTQSQLAELAKYVQRDASYVENVKALGFTINSHNALSIWSRGEYNGSNAYSWHINPEGSNSHNGPKSDNRRQVVCLGD